MDVYSKGCRVFGKKEGESKACKDFSKACLRAHSPASSSPWLTILTFLRGLQVMPPTPPSPPLHLLAPAAYHPYACGVPSQHDFDTAYHPYARIVPAQHASNAAYHPYACSALPTCL
ncbi:hypothetical protein O181_013206 [Austropuccinia psidii MF-1]|uniref:Uncharacterized protein n=1 Tax=Austropuccinia psidii MF-1 TaxID=1389203 RepID=A0A9Q3BVZ8_9BASI|nr:hypothetical protein [Austropuccinia psidii MF-1]